MGLVVVACLVLAQVSVDSSYFGDVFVGLLIFGVGLGAAFTASQVAALDGVAEQDSGLAAGLVDTSFTVGGALGLAILSTVAAARTGNEGNGTGQPAQLLAMAEGLQPAFAMAAGFAGFGLIAAIVLLGPRHATGDACTHAVPAAPTDSRS